MIDELYEATKKGVMTTKEEYRNADVPMPRGPNDLEEKGEVNISKENCNDR